LTSFLICGAFSAVMNASSAVSEISVHVVVGADPAVCHHDHAREAEALLDLLDLRGQRLAVFQ